MSFLKTVAVDAESFLAKVLQTWSPKSPLTAL